MAHMPFGRSERHSRYPGENWAICHCLVAVDSRHSGLDPEDFVK